MKLNTTHVHLVLFMLSCFFFQAQSQSIEEPKKFQNFFEVELSFNLLPDAQKSFLSELNKLPHVNKVIWIEPRTFCIAADKPFVIEQIKPLVEKFHLSIERYSESYRSAQLTCKQIAD